MYVEPCTPFSFIINQLTAAEQERQLEAVEPPKRSRGRPPKPVEAPLAVNAHRHHLSDLDPENCKLGPKDRSNLKAEYDVLVLRGTSTVMAINSLLKRYCVTYKEAFDICRV
jgi:hypothetical protein